VTELLALVDGVNSGASTALPLSALRVLRTWSGDQPVGIRRIHAGADSLAAELLVPDPDGAPREWVLKVHRDIPKAPRPAAIRARHEWNTLHSLSGLRVAGRRAVPEPVHLMADDGWLVMEACEGTKLSDLIRAGRATRDAAAWPALLDALQRTGQWCREFQRRTWNPAAAVPAEMLWRESIRADIARCRGKLPRYLLDAASATLAHRATVDGLPSVSCHGDFWPGNVFVSANGVKVIDFEGMRPGTAYEDVAYFLIQLELFFSHPASQNRSLHAAAAFLDGYLQGDELQRGHYQMARIVKTMQIAGRTPVPCGADIRTRWRLRLLRELLERELL
jgi:aminoglycoside phosphotransferase (APT) family kinase protein